ncbi:Ig-like domain-containing protein [Skermanella stibiiresistens]|uniref:Ig-like domain-containing protein n=1 Tax=Skermanella stibiiresistens TaxID=913326 RepID=UPI001FE1C839|nr:Ig-like domain-containing protein [Skermanella stibiiresistens]
MGDAIIVKSSTSGDSSFGQFNTDIALLADGDIVVSWETFSGETGVDIHAQRLSLSSLQPSNSAPVAVDGHSVIAEDAPLTGHVSATDVNGDKLAYALLDEARHGKLLFSADGSFSYTPDKDFHGTDSFTFKAADGSLESAVATHTITIDPVNDAPVIGGSAKLDLASGVLSAVVGRDALSVSDIDSPAAELTYTLATGPGTGSLTLAGATLKAGAVFTDADIAAGRLVYTPGATTNTSDAFEVTTSDGHATSGATRIAVSLAAPQVVQTEAKYGGYWGGSGSDFLQGKETADQLTGGDGDDVLNGNGGNDSLYGGAGNDRVHGGAGDDIITGDDGDDFLDGGAGRDMIYGGAGRDILTGGAGDADALFGGVGADRFVFHLGDGKDRVEDFRRSEGDVIDLRDLGLVAKGIDSFADLKAAGMVQSPQYGGDTVLKFSETDILTIKYVNASQMAESDYWFV